MSLYEDQLTNSVDTPFEVRNFNERFFYPSNHLQEGLEKVVVFLENTKDCEVPNGSYWEYSSAQYNPALLKDDVGCGMTGYLIPRISVDEDLAQGLLGDLKRNKIQIGRGNHFISILEAGGLGSPADMLLVHSDFNPEKIIPKTYEQARERMTQARNQREETAQKIADMLGVNTNFFQDWTHNAVTQTENGLVYRKGSINVNESEGFGLLACNPWDGVLLYSANWDAFDGHMQHGTGIKRVARTKFEQLFSDGKYIAYIPSIERPDDLYQEFNKPSEVIEAFPEGFAPSYQLKTKVTFRTP